MKIHIERLGALKQAEFTIGPLTIICGENNTGKSYATHACYGFLDYLRSNTIFPVADPMIDHLFSEGSVCIELEHYRKDLTKHLDKASKRYSEVLFKVFAGNESLFKESALSISFGDTRNMPFAHVNLKLGSAERGVLHIHSTAENSALEVSLIVDKSSDDIPPRNIIKSMISDAIGNAMFEGLVPRPFLASAERTGAAIFQKELDFTRNRLLEMLGDKSTKLHPFQLLKKFSGEYPIAVRRNVDFIRELSNITHRDSFILKQHPEILDDFQEIIGGAYKVSKEGEVQYIPSSNKRIRLSLVESSSAVRSLLDIGFYLRHVATPGDLLMVDEPELNLHPENQRRVARLFARLVNIGIKVFITTHSDYIIKELNTLIMLHRDDPRLRSLAQQEGYSTSELLDPRKVYVYIAEEALIKLDGAKRRSRSLTLVPATIDPQWGIEAKSFDKTIEEMNRIQDLILWGEDA